MTTKEEALKLADELDALHQYVPSEAPAMIRRLVEELDKKPLSDDEIMEIVADKYGKGHGRYIDTKLFFVEFAKAIEERHGIK